MLGLPVMVAVWSLGGLYLSLVPSILQQIFDNHDGLVNGLAIATMFGVGSVLPSLLRRFAPPVARAIGMSSIAAGVVVIGLSLASHSVALFFIGSAVAGVGFGTAFSAQVQQIAPLARSHERAELLAVIYVASYLAFSVPAMSAGLLSTALGYLAFLALASGFWLGCGASMGGVAPGLGASGLAAFFGVTPG